MARKRTAAQLQRDIDAVLGTERSRLHHATVADDWDVAMDALLERDPKRAAKIVKRIHAEHGITTDMSPGFSKALREASNAIRDRFLEDAAQPLGKLKRLKVGDLIRYRAWEPSGMEFYGRIHHLYPGRAREGKIVSTVDVETLSRDELWGPPQWRHPDERNYVLVDDIVDNLTVNRRE